MPVPSSYSQGFSPCLPPSHIPQAWLAERAHLVFYIQSHSFHWATYSKNSHFLQFWPFCQDTTRYCQAPQDISFHFFCPFMSSFAAKHLSFLLHKNVLSNLANSFLALCPPAFQRFLLGVAVSGSGLALLPDAAHTLDASAVPLPAPCDFSLLIILSLLALL